MIWVNQILQGVLLGGYYAMLACGLSLMFGVMRIINLAHGSLAVVAAYLVWVVANRLHFSPFLGLALVLPCMALVGWLLQRLVFERSLGAGELVPLLSTFGLAVVLDNSMFQTFGADSRSLAPNIGDLAWNSWGVTSQIYVGQLPLLTFVAAVALLGGLHLFLLRTPMGRSVRATTEDPDTAELVGIDTRKVYGFAAAASLVAVGFAGTFLAMRAAFDPYAGPAQLIFAFEAIVIGGTGSLWGTLVGGVVLGVAQNLGAQVSPQGFLVAGHAAFLAVLALRFFAGGRGLRSLLRIPRRPSA